MIWISPELHGNSSERSNFNQTTRQRISGMATARSTALAGLTRRSQRPNGRLNWTRCRPLSTRIVLIRCTYARRYDEAMAQLKKAIELDPAFFYSRQILGTVLQAKGDLPGAIAEFEKARQLSGDPMHLVLLAVAKTKMGDKSIAQQALAELDRTNRDRQGLAYDHALLYIGIGNKEEALHWLEQSYADRDGANLSWINVEPMLDPLRGEPRFEALVQKVIAPKS